MSLRVGVEPALLRWACGRSGRSIEDLRRRFPRLEAWEQGAVLPTLKQLEDFARAARTPIGYLFLREPPVEELPITDFRTVRGVRLERPSADLLDTLYLCQQRQDWYRDEARTAGQPPLGSIGSLDTSIDPVSAGVRLRDALGFDVEHRRESRTWTEALRRFIEQAEALGILVMVSGVVGSNTQRRLDPDEFRGFALSDPLAPLVFINGADSKAAQMFTLAHEIAHLWVDESGVSNSQAVTVPDHSVERWCNQVAAELLVPSDLLGKEFDPGAALSEETSRLARLFKVSTLVVLRSIHDAGALTSDDFWSAYWNEVRRLRKVRDSRGDSGGNFYLSVGARASKRFARALVVSTLEGRTSYSESFRLLGVKKLSTFEGLAVSLGVSV